MITIVNPDIETEIVLSEEKTTVLIAESPREYYKLVTEMAKALDGDPSDFSFWSDSERIKPDKCGEMLLNVLSFDLSDKKIVSLLFKKLQSNYLDIGLLAELNKINAGVGVFLQELFGTVDFALDYDELTIEDLLKACAVKPSKAYESLLEKIVCYINVFIELKNIEFFVFVGLKDVLTDDDLKLLYDHCALKKVGLLLIERFKERPLLAEEQAIIITDDLCEIIENYDQK